MTDDLATLPWYPPDERTPNGATGRKPCRRHRWVWRNIDEAAAGGPNNVCSRCHAVRDAARATRGRTSLRAGKDAERAIARSYGGKRTGQYGGPDDVVVGELFVVQSKVRAAFPSWMWDELAKLPRSGGRIPTLIVSDRPGPGHRTRRLVVRTMDDDLALHGDKP